MSIAPLLTVELPDEAATRRFGAALAEILVGGDVVLAIGELGTGKTTLASGLAAGLGAGEAAFSPSFALCHLYGSDPVLAHVDCWRLTRPEELDDLALTELLEDGAIAYIEWGELARDRFGADAFAVHLEETEGGSSRRATVSFSGHARDRRDALHVVLERHDFSPTTHEPVRQ